MTKLLQTIIDSGKNSNYWETSITISRFQKEEPGEL